MVLTTEVAALKRLMRSKQNVTNVTQKQVFVLVMLFEEAIPGIKKKERIAIMDYLIGDVMWDLFHVKVESFKNMTSNIASILIDEISEKNNDKLEISEQGKELLIGCQKSLEAGNIGGTQPVDGERMAMHLPTL
jgi:hypothetical protein